MNIETRILAGANQADLAFDPLHFFDGPVACDGFIADRSGRVRRSFTIMFSGVRRGDVIDIFEIMQFNDGEVKERRWQIEPSSTAHWQAKANDIPGSISIVQGDHPGEARWTYDMELPIGKRSIGFAFEDVMVMTAPDIMTAVTHIRKFGIKVAEIITSYRRLAGQNLADNC